MLSETLRLDRCSIASIRPEDGRADVTHQVGHDSVPALPDRLPLADFTTSTSIAPDGTLVIDDAFERQGLSETDRANSRRSGLRALVSPCLREGADTPHWAMVAVCAHPRPMD